jgi:dTDP-4-dehydrorhamnose 3,5-epimerase
MKIESVGIDGIWIIQNETHVDQRGSFQEWFQSESFQEYTGVNFIPKQANSSFSKKGVVRGIHYSTSEAGQAKLVTCMNGEILDVIFDLRRDSKTFGQFASIPLKAHDGKSIYISEGLGHAFMSLQDNSNLVYLLSSTYDPSTEHTVHPLDATFGFKWPMEGIILSERDSLAPSLVEQIKVDNLPRMKKVDPII